MEEEMGASMQPPMVETAPERLFARLRQITIRADDEIEAVNGLLSDGWRLISIGYRPDATVYVLGQTDQKRKQRAGFGFMRAEDEAK